MKLFKISLVMMMIFTGMNVFAAGEGETTVQGNCGAHINGSTLTGEGGGGTDSAPQTETGDVRTNI